MDFNGTNLSAQLLILIKGLAMTASWLFAYSSVRQLPMSFSGAVKASGPIWTLMGGMLVLVNFFLTCNLRPFLFPFCVLFFVTDWEISKHFSPPQPATCNDAACNNPVRFCSPHDKRCKARQKSAHDL